MKQTRGRINRVAKKVAEASDRIRSDPEFASEVCHLYDETQERYVREIKRFKSGYDELYDKVVENDQSIDTLAFTMKQIKDQKEKLRSDLDEIKQDHERSMTVLQNSFLDQMAELKKDLKAVRESVEKNAKAKRVTKKKPKKSTTPTTEVVDLTSNGDSDSEWGGYNSESDEELQKINKEQDAKARWYESDSDYQSYYSDEDPVYPVNPLKEAVREHKQDKATLLERIRTVNQDIRKRLGKVINN